MQKYFLQATIQKQEVEPSVERKIKGETKMTACRQTSRNFMAFLVLISILASGTNASAKEVQMETMIVTAEKQEQDIQKVPASITAFSEVDMEERGIVNMLELARFTPNMVVRNMFENEIVVRGISVPHQSVMQSNVGFYVDGVNYPITLMQNPDLYDIERIEVLKGPQGTLYGRNSLSGVINIITRKPGNTTRAALTGEYSLYRPDHGTVPGYTLQGNASGPVIRDKLYIGLAGQLKQSDGYIKNITLNDSQAARINRLNGRITFRFTPSDSLDISLNTDYLHTDDGDGYNQYVSSGMMWNGTGFTPVDYSTDYHQIAWDGKNFRDQDSNGQSLHLKYSGKHIDIVSITARKGWDAELANDAGSVRYRMETGWPIITPVLSVRN